MSSQSPQTSSELPKLDYTPFLAPAYVGLALSSISLKIRSDHWFHKSTVVTFWILDTTNQILIIYTMYFFTVLNFANPLIFLIGHWSAYAVLLLNVYVLSSGCGPLSDIIDLLDLSYLEIPPEHLARRNLCDFVANPLRYHIDVPYQMLRWEGIAGVCVSLMTNAFLAATMTFSLTQQRTGLRKSDHIIKKLVILTLATGALPSVIELAELLAYLIAPRTWYELLFSFTKSKFYVLSFLTILNMRESIRNGQGTHTTDQINSIPLTKLGIERPAKNSQPINILVTESTDTDQPLGANKPSLEV
ncbi:hypothetical protein NM688_g3684 [Phlebia brevispora]|uniref:Uncharacterized protein n=1 Tax=Phlebia brevispora TaxID=194682 RepID=A0ACC1T517_9APHY|nr:hypothetical protein NM688_g3684 [Phlebia brevispora]